MQSALSCVACVALLAHAPHALADATSSAAGSTEAAEAPLPFRYSELSFQQTLSANTFDPSSQLSYDPTYSWTFGLLLYWHFSEQTFASVQQLLSLELTDQSNVSSRQRALLSDTDLRLFQELSSVPLGRARGFTLLGGAQLMAPTSLASQAAGMIAAAGPRLVATFTFRDLLEGARIRLTGAYLYRFSNATTVAADTPYPCVSTDGALASCAYLGSATSPRDIVQASLIGEVMLTDQLSALLWLRFDFWRAHALLPAQITTDTGSVVTLDDESNTHSRNSRTLLLSATYKLLRFLDLSLLFTNTFTERSPNGRVRAPLRPVDTMLSLGATFLLDEIYLAAEGKPRHAVRVETP